MTDSSNVTRAGSRLSFLTMLSIVAFCFLLVACTSESTDADGSGSGAPVRECAIQGFSCKPRASQPDTISITVNPKLQTAIASGTATFATSDCTLTTSKVYLGRVPGGADITLDFKCSGPLPKKLTGVVTITYAFENGEPTQSVGTVRFVKS